MKRALIVIPTYNERHNILRVLSLVLGLPADRLAGYVLDVLIVDDASPDGTAAVVEAVKVEYPDRIHLLQRKGKLGLGTAYIAGFTWALRQPADYAVVFEMDADLSHDPHEIPRFLEAIEAGADLVLGSRYIKGVNVINWPLSRLLLSYGANIYTRAVTGVPVMDATGGFKAFRRSVLEAIRLDQVRSNGYSFQIEMTYRAWRRGFTILEIPIVFTDRAEGLSKMNRNIVREAIGMVWKLKARHLTGRL